LKNKKLKEQQIKKFLENLLKNVVMKFKSLEGKNDK
tara:strand:- start:576 stop:683 length:108 start_codon:yes stop_codon:yes gene_type:complete